MNIREYIYVCTYIYTYIHIRFQNIVHFRIILLLDLAIPTHRAAAAPWPMLAEATLNPALDPKAMATYPSNSPPLPYTQIRTNFDFWVFTWYLSIWVYWVEFGAALTLQTHLWIVIVIVFCWHVDFFLKCVITITCNQQHCLLYIAYWLPIDCPWYTYVQPYSIWARDPRPRSIIAEHMCIKGNQ